MPEEIGALTRAPILSDEVDYDDSGHVTQVGRVYWFEQYQAVDEIKELRRNPFLIFEGVD